MNTPPKGVNPSDSGIILRVLEDQEVILKGRIGDSVLIWSYNRPYLEPLWRGHLVPKRYYTLLAITAPLWYTCMVDQPHPRVVSSNVLFTNGT